MGSKQTQIPVLLMTEEQKRLLNKPEISMDEGSGFHLSNAYYNHKTKDWVQRKIHNKEPEKAQTYRKELNNLEKIRSFKTYVKEFSEINPESQYIPNADVKTNKSKLDALDTGKPKYTTANINKKFERFIKADPLSS